MSAGQPWDWNTLPERTPDEARRLRRHLLVAAALYLAWSVGCLGLHWCQASATSLSSFGPAALLAGGPPLLLGVVGTEALHIMPFYRRSPACSPLARS